MCQNAWLTFTSDSEILIEWNSKYSMRLVILFLSFLYKISLHLKMMPFIMMKLLMRPPCSHKKIYPQEETILEVFMWLGRRYCNMTGKSLTILVVNAIHTFHVCRSYDECDESRWGDGWMELGILMSNWNRPVKPRHRLILCICGVGSLCSPSALRKPPGWEKLAVVHM